MSKRVTRRVFLERTGRVLTVAAASTLATRAAAANDRLGVGLIGCGGQGRYVINSICWERPETARILAVCDVDQERMDETCEETQRYFGNTPDQHKDFRALLERKDIDVVAIGTPDHWHAPMTILACQAGKDVYVEKPCSHTIHEGRQMVKAARKYGRIVMVGQHQRGVPHFRQAMDYLRRGQPLGRITRTATMNFQNESPQKIGMGSDERPAHVSDADYDLWLGPAPKRPFNSNRWHYNWRWFYDYGGGMICDWNVHLQDLVHWGMGVDAPRSVTAVGGKRVLADNRETVDVMDVLYEYQGPHGPFTQVYAMTKAYHHGVYPEPYGTEFYGTEGSLFINRGFWQITPDGPYRRVDDPDNPAERGTLAERRRWSGTDTLSHIVRNFLEVVDSRRVEDLYCDIEVGHRTATVCHLGNIAMRLGRTIWWDRERELILRQDGSPDRKANRLLTKEYRKGYELPRV